MRHYQLPRAHALGVSLIVLACSSAAFTATIRVADWNMANLPNNPTDDTNLDRVLAYAGSDHPIDVIALAETDTSSAPETAIDFAHTYGSTYAELTTTADGGGDRTGFVYSTSTLQLVSYTTVGSGTITHPSLRALFRPVGTSGADDFYCYAVHLQSGSTMAIKQTRVVQAAILRADADAVGSANVIFGGDFNWQKADDVSVGVGAYRTLNAPGAGQVFDPVNQVGNWHDNAAYKLWHTEDPGANMDDRFDMQMISSELTDGVGLEYVTDSYHVIGNNGTHMLGGLITSGTGAPTDVLNTLVNFSDHLPVVADYTFAVPEPGSMTSLVVVAAFGLTRRRRAVV